MNPQIRSIFFTIVAGLILGACAPAQFVTVPTHTPVSIANPTAQVTSTVVATATMPPTQPPASETVAAASPTTPPATVSGPTPSPELSETDCFVTAQEPGIPIESAPFI